jgi:hypothetical protein
LVKTDNFLKKIQKNENLTKKNDSIMAGFKPGTHFDTKIDFFSLQFEINVGSLFFVIFNDFGL